MEPFNKSVDRASSDLSQQQMLANHGKIWRRYDPAIKSAHWRRDSKGLDQHAQAARRPATDNRKNDSACAQCCNERLSACGQHLVISHQRAIDIRNHCRAFEWQCARATQDFDRSRAAHAK